MAPDKMVGNVASSETYFYSIAGILALLVVHLWVESIFEELVRDDVDQTETALSHMLLERLSKKNYIPENARENYGRAFVREFRKFLGHTVEDGDVEGLVIKVLGAGCVICDGLENAVMETLSSMGLAADLEHVRDDEQISEYRVKGTPALVINGRVMCTGRNPSNPGDAMVHVLDGEATVDIDGKKMTVDTGQVVVMPANVPHAVTAVKRFKMILTVVKKPVTIQS